MKRVSLWRQAVAVASLSTLFTVYGSCESAQAGTYVIHNCPASEQPNFDAGPWHASNSAPLPSVGGFQASCTPGSNTLGTAIGWYANQQTLNTNLGVELTTPSSEVTIRKVRVIWSVYHSADGSDTFAEVISGSGSELISPTPFSAGPTNASNVYFPDGTREIFVGDYCSYDASANCGFSSNTSPVIRLEGMDTTLEDSSTPSGVSNGGALAGNGPISGKATLQYTATDSGSGVREVELLVDGSAISTNSYAGQCPYLDFAACPQTVTGLFAINTSALSNGTHYVALRITSASGNSQVMGDHPTLIANEEPQGDLVSPPPCTAATNTNTALKLRLGSPELTSNYRQGRNIAGLLTSQGTALADATIEVLSRPDTSSNSFSLLAQATTNRRGQFYVKLGARESQAICLRYKALSGGLYAATASINQSVRAGLRLTPSSHRAASNGTVHFRGEILGGFVPPLGKIIELQVYYLGSWRVFRTPRTDTAGRFRSFYTFLGGRGTFDFRACARAESGYPFAFGCSGVVAIRAG